MAKELTVHKNRISGMYYLGYNVRNPDKRIDFSDINSMLNYLRSNDEEAASLRSRRNLVFHLDVPDSEYALLESSLIAVCPKSTIAKIQGRH